MVDRAVEGRHLLFALALVAVCAGCTTAPPQPSATAGEPNGIAGPSDCRQRIEAAKLDNEATIFDVDECRFTLAGTQAARDVLMAATQRDVLWAAIWVYGSTASDAQPLLPLLNNSDPSIRVMSGGTLVSLGRSEAFGALKASLSEQGFVAGSAPPIRIAQYAASVLSRFVVADGLPLVATDATQVDTAANAWMDWLDQHSAELMFDPATGRWHVG